MTDRARQIEQALLRVFDRLGVKPQKLERVSLVSPHLSAVDTDASIMVDDERIAVYRLADLIDDELP